MHGLTLNASLSTHLPSFDIFQPNIHDIFEHPPPSRWSFQIWDLIGVFRREEMRVDHQVCMTHLSTSMPTNITFRHFCPVFAMFRPCSKQPPSLRCRSREGMRDSSSTTWYGHHLCCGIAQHHNSGEGYWSVIPCSIARCHWGGRVIFRASFMPFTNGA